MSNRRAKISKRIPIIQYRQEFVVTTSTMADLYDVDDNTVHSRYSHNKSCFKENEHFFMLKGEALRDFKNRFCNAGPHPAKAFHRASALSLWTERGAAQHAEMLGTDVARAAFDALKSSYFRPAEVKPLFVDVFREMFDRYLSLGISDTKAAFLAANVASYRVPSEV
jgi:hypothetical protein